METLKVDRTKLYTPTAYAKKIGLTVAGVKKQMATGKLKTVKINGHVLVYEK